MITGQNVEKTDGSVSHSTDARPYDLSMLEELEDDEYVVEMLTIFLNETPVVLLKIRDALNTSSTETICTEAHNLKNSAGVLQADQLIYLLTKIERIARLGKVTVELIKLIADVHQEHKNIEYELKKHIESMKL